MLPLLLAAGAGAIRGAFGIAGARRALKQQKSAIGRAYGVAQTRMVRNQGDVRQAMTEGEIGRGIVQMGAQQAGGSLAHAQNHANATDELWHAQSSRGAVGAANTLGGHEQAQLTDEFWNDRADLAGQRKEALQGAKAGANAAYAGAIEGGMNTAANVYGAATQLGAMRTPSLPKGPAPTYPGLPDGQAPMPSAMPIPGAFGLNPIDPTLPPGATPALPNWMFHVGGSGGMATDPYSGGY